MEPIAQPAIGADLRPIDASRRCRQHVVIQPRDYGTTVAFCVAVGKGVAMSLVRLIGFKTLGCGCLAGHYLELATTREIAYIEEKGSACAVHAHRRNHKVLPERVARPRVTLLTARAS